METTQFLALYLLFPEKEGDNVLSQREHYLYLFLAQNRSIAQW